MEEAFELQSQDVLVSGHKRVFTLAQANATLPLVGRIVNDIVTLYQDMASTQQRLAGDALPPVEREKLEMAAVSQELKFDGYIDELSDIGCELKDANIGLVDFIGQHDGRNVYLCWRLGEKQIEFWHELHSGFSGRNSVTALNEK